MAQPMFERISGRSPAFRRFLEEVELLHYDKTEHIYRQGNPSTFLYLVRDGEVQIRQQRGEGQKPRIIGIHSRGSLFGEVSFLTGEAHSSDAIASLDSNVYRIRGELFVRLLSEEPSVGQCLAQLLSVRVKHNMLPASPEVPASIHTLFYPEDPRRGSELCGALARALTRVNPDSVLLLNLSRHSIFEGQSFPRLLDILDAWPDIRVSEALESAEYNPGGFDVLVGQGIHDGDVNVDRLATVIPAFLGRLKKYYAAILVDAGRHVENPVLARVLSQSDDILLVRNPQQLNDSGQGEIWREVVAYCTELIDDFFGRVITISDEKGGRNSSRSFEAEAFPGMNPNSALYRNHVHLRSLGEESPLENRERSFVSGINRLARRISGTSRGLCLGGGGARAFAHIGVIEVLEQEGYDFDAVVGTSMGAVIGAGYAMGYDAHTLTEMVGDIIPNSEMILDKRVPLVSFFRGHKLNRAILKAFGDSRFEDLDIPFYCNGSDLDQARVVVFEQGFIASAIRASVSLPGIFPPVRMNGFTLVDGGVLNNMPGDILRDKGQNRVIGVNVTPIHDMRSSETSVGDRRGSIFQRIRDYFSLPPILKIINRAIAIQGVELLKAKLDDFDYVLHPDVHDFDVFDFHRRDEIIDAGRRAAVQALPEITEALARPNLGH